MYNTPTRRNQPDGYRGNRIVFRSVGIIIAVILAIFALEFATHRDGAAGFVSILFAIFIFLYVLVKQRPAARSWLTLLGIVLLAVVIIGIMEM
jgi:hypothetical protein